MVKCIDIPASYAEFIAEIRGRVQAARIRAALAVNSELIQLYWEIGRVLTLKRDEEGWGANIIERLARDIQGAYPGLKGFSRSNIFRMRKFYLCTQKVAQFARQMKDEECPVLFKALPWWHNVLICEKLTSAEAALWYANQTIEHGWSRSRLEDAIRNRFFERRGQAITNFETSLPPPQSKLAKETLKDPYNFDFLALAEGYRETELEQGLIDHIQKFLVELGAGFAYVGRQVHLQVGSEDYYLDLLFYHLKLRCYCVIELKNTKFKPEYAGKLNFYLSAVDDLMRHEEDRQTIGMLLCKTRDDFTVEYALRDICKPIGVAGFEQEIIDSLPENLRGTLPTVEEIETGLKILIYD